MKLIHRLRRLEEAAASAPSIDPDRPPADWWGLRLLKDLGGRGIPEARCEPDPQGWHDHVRRCQEIGADPWGFDEFLKYAVRR